MDVGFSGGPSGARNGGSLMIGGEKARSLSALSRFSATFPFRTAIRTSATRARATL